MKQYSIVDQLEVMILLEVVNLIVCLVRTISLARELPYNLCTANKKKYIQIMIKYNINNFWTLKTKGGVTWLKQCELVADHICSHNSYCTQHTNFSL